ncbi:hypothetical protein K440DRAFT_683515 [Wilcoxina mikolae CBS 423.85]|nr:hypothetical protein K440DRAFT_683515 [Wilcoxina mikolae CBS 423.85]
MNDIDMEDFGISRLGDMMNSFCRVVSSTQCSDATRRASDEEDFDLPSRKRPKTSGVNLVRMDTSIRNNTEFGSVAVGIGKAKRIGSLFTIRSTEDRYLGAIIPEHAQKLRISSPEFVLIYGQIYFSFLIASNVGDLLSREGLFLQEPVSCDDDGARYFNPHTLFVPEEIRLELELEAEDMRNGLSTLETYKSQED